MRRTLVGAAAACVLGLASPASASAINSYNAVPAPERTETGATLVAWDQDQDGTIDHFTWDCSGAMVDDDTFLTAGHCTSVWEKKGGRMFVSLEPDVQTLLDAHADLSAVDELNLFIANGWAVEGTPHTDPGFAGKNDADTHDIGVIDFADRALTPQDVWDFTPATLPTAGQLDSYPRKQLSTTTWWAVGYGTQEGTRGPGGHTYPGGGVRMKAPLGFTTLTKDWIRFSMNEKKGYGGACSGDSGGPVFADLGGRLTLVATTITGDTPCYATNVAKRMDTADSQAFLSRFVTLP